MTVDSGTGLLSQVIELGWWAGSCDIASLPRLGDLLLWAPGRSGRRRLRRRGVGLGLLEQVVGAGEQLAGDGRGGDLLAPTSSHGRVAGGELGMAFGGLGGLAEDPAQLRGALLGDVAVTNGAV